ncbi:MAG: anti-sigma factor domain-containing protein [Streptosporangiaceae bacterium]
MSHLDPELLALIALGEPAASAADHLSGCADCQAEMRKLAAVVAVARRQDAIEPLEAPPPELWTRIAAAAGVDPAVAPQLSRPAANGSAPGDALTPGRPAPDGPADRHADTDAQVAPDRAAGARAPGGPGPQAGPAGHRPWWRRRPLAAAAAGALAGLIIGAGGAVAVHQLGTQQPAASVVAKIALRPLPQFPQWKDASGTAVMESASGGRVLSVRLHARRPSGFYEVWLLARNGVSMISLGDLGPDGTGAFSLPPGVDLANYSRIDVSLQQFNGSPVHSRISVVRGSLP